MSPKEIFGHRRDEVPGQWRQLHMEEHYDLHCSPNITGVIKSKRMRWAEQVACSGDRRSAYRVLVDRPDRKRALGWDDDSKELGMLTLDVELNS